MKERNLSRPVTVEQEYQAAILERLDTLVELLRTAIPPGRSEVGADPSQPAQAGPPARGKRKRQRG